MTNNGITAYQWTQVQIPTSTGAQTPIVLFQRANTATPTFLAPTLQYDTMLAFSLKVMDSDGGAISSNPAIVYIMVKHNPNISQTGSSTTPGTTIIQTQREQQQSHQPIVPSTPNIVYPSIRR